MREASAPVRAGRIRSGSLEAFEQRLRTLGETFAFVVELLQNLEPRFPLRRPRARPREARFRFAQRACVFLRDRFLGGGNFRRPFLQVPARSRLVRALFRAALCESIARGSSRRLTTPPKSASMRRGRGAALVVLGDFLFQIGEPVFRFRKRKLEACSACSCASRSRAHFRRALGRFASVPLSFGLEQPLGFLEQRVGFVNLALLLRELCFGGGDVALVALDQCAQFLRALAIEFDPAAMRRDLVLQALHFGRAPR